MTSGVQRYTFGCMDLLDGISFLLLAMATFALTEGLLMILNRQDTTGVFNAQNIGKISDLKVTKEEFKKIAPTIGRCSLLGFFIGALPGAGATLGSFLSYGMERNLASPEDRKEFGKGSLIGLAAPETGNNAASSGSFVPLLTLGIPGSGTTAVMLGALIAYGIDPGPRMFVDHPDVFWGVIMSMYLGNVFLLVINLPLIPYFARLLAVPKKILIPYIFYFSIIGVYLVTFNTFDIFMMMVFAFVALIGRMLSYPMAPLLLGFILGGLLEDNLVRSLEIYNGSLAFLYQRPVTLAINMATLCFLIMPAIQLIKSRKKTSE
jgi:putative tricarboxylic transport membrane protein